MFSDLEMDKYVSFNAEKRNHIVSFGMIKPSERKIAKQLQFSYTTVHIAILDSRLF